MQKVNFYMSNENKNGFSKSKKCLGASFSNWFIIPCWCFYLLDVILLMLFSRMNSGVVVKWNGSTSILPTSHPHPHLHAPSFACITQIICIVKVHTQTFKSLSINTNTILINHKLRFKCRLFERGSSLASC